MAELYYAAINHTNTTNAETAVKNIESTQEEPKKIVAVVISHNTNSGVMRFYHERDNFGEIITGNLDTFMGRPIEIDRELPVGESFDITLTHVSAGSNAFVEGFIIYEIMGRL